uniref:Uncharacterized protein n=1 Tax=Haptolina ericina TaxID=156174 RepID=A0A7S3FFM2_9EUKA
MREAARRPAEVPPTGTAQSVCIQDEVQQDRRCSLDAIVIGGDPGGGLLRGISKARRHQIGIYVRGSKAKKLLDGGGAAAAERRERRDKALERDRARAIARSASLADVDTRVASPLLALFTTAQVEDDEEEVGKDFELRGESESEDDYYFE